MIEISLILSNLVLISIIVAYFYFKEMRVNKIEQSLYTQVTDKVLAGLQSTLTVLEKTTTLKDNLLQKTQTDYLKHLEKMAEMAKPRPLHMESPVTPMPIENEIEQEEEEERQRELEDMISRIPITRDTKVAFEDNEISQPDEQIVT